MILRPYQNDLVDRSREALRRVNRLLVQSPTGSGKTAMLVHMMSTARDRGFSSIFSVHQKELIRQTSRALWEQRLEHGQIVSGRRLSDLPVNVASIQTLVRRLDKVAEPSLFIIDEAHRTAAATYLRVLNQFPNAKVIGLTATPQRTDGKGLGHIFDELICGPSISQLIEAGYLADYELLAPPNDLDLTKVKTQAGDYEKEGLEKAVDKPKIIGDAVDHYVQHANGKRCVVMCVSIAHARHVVEQYQARGIAADLIYGDMDDDAREEMLVRFAAGGLKVLANVQLMIEGVDIPAIEVIQWLRPTQSLIIWMQGNGRGLRPFEDQEQRLLILDHVGNWKKHGLPDDDRNWELNPPKKPRRRGNAREEVDPDFKIRQCTECHAIFRAHLDECPNCGHPVPGGGIAQIEVVEGQLEKIDLVAERRERRREVGQARTLEDLIILGIRRGMNRPAEWAMHVIAGRESRKPTLKENREARRILAEIKLHGRAA